MASELEEYKRCERSFAAGFVFGILAQVVGRLFSIRPPLALCMGLAAFFIYLLYKEQVYARARRRVYVRRP